LKNAIESVSFGEQSSEAQRIQFSEGSTVAIGWGHGNSGGTGDPGVRLGADFFIELCNGNMMLTSRTDDVKIISLSAAP